MPPTRAGGLREVFDPRVRTVVVIGVVLAVFQQWCGINVIFNYAEEIFASAGYGVSDILFNIVITGIVNLVFTLWPRTGGPLGPAPLMLAGRAASRCYTALWAVCTRAAGPALLLVLALAAIGCYAMSLAPVTWVIISEIFPTASAAPACRSRSPPCGSPALS